MWKSSVKTRIAVVLAAALGIGVLSSWASDGMKSHYAPGTYLASAEGIGTVLVAVTVDESSILSIDVDAAQESPDVGGKAAGVLADQILQKQSVKVDNISGATVTSTAVKKAVEAALRKGSARAEENNKQAEMDEIAESLSSMREELDALKEENENLAEDYQKLLSENESQAQRVQDLSAANEELSEKNASLERQLTLQESTKTKELPLNPTATVTEKPKKESKKEKETKAEETTSAEEKTEETTQELPVNLVSMTPVKVTEAPKQESYTNDPAFVYDYVGSNIIFMVQEALENLGYSLGGPDGYWGPGTVEQVSNFQAINGLDVTGELNGETVKYLLGYDEPGWSEAQEGISSNVSMEDANIVSFAYTDLGYGDDGESYEVGLDVTNNGKNTISDISIDCVWYNIYGIRINTTNTFGNGKLKAGKTAGTKAILKGEDMIGNMISMGVGAYTYHLAKKDERGYSTYHVNLLTGEVQGS